jgi:hypothetical protein
LFAARRANAAGQRLLPAAAIVSGARCQSRSADTNGGRRFEQNEEFRMLTVIAVVLLVLWLLGIVSSYTMGGFIHILLVVAVVVVLLRIIQGRRVT